MIMLPLHLSSCCLQLTGKTLEEGGLFNLSGMSLMAIIREGTAIYRQPQQAASASKKKGIFGGLFAKNRSQNATAVPPANPNAASGVREAESAHGITASSSSNQLSSSFSSEQGVPLRLRSGDVLFFRGDYQQLQQHAERLGLIILTSDLTPLPDAVAAALDGPLPPAATARPAAPGATGHPGDGKVQHISEKLGLRFLARMEGGDAEKGKGGDQASLKAGNRNSLLRKASAIGWSGANMWLFRVSGTEDFPGIVIAFHSLP